MFRTKSRVALLLLSGVLGVSALLSVLPPLGAWQVPGGPPLPPSTREPPFADPRGAVSPTNPGGGDPPTPMVGLKLRVPTTVAPGQELEGKIRIENTVRADAHHVLVIMPIPAEADFVRAVPPPKVVQPEIVWEIGTLNGCRYKEITFVLQPKGNQEVRTCARVQFEHGQCAVTGVGNAPQNPPNVPIPTPPNQPLPATGQIPGLRIEKRGPKTATVGQVLDYEIVVTNETQRDFLALQVFDQLGAGLQYQGREGDTLRFPVIPRLEAAKVWRQTYKVEAKAPGRHCNEAIVSVDGKQNSTKICVDVAGRVAPIERKIGLNLRVPAQDPIYINTPIPVQLTVTNRGNTPLDNLDLTAVLPQQTRFLSASDNGQPGLNDVRWRLTNLAPGASREVQYVISATAEGNIPLRAEVRSGRVLEAEEEKQLSVRRFTDREGFHFSVIDEGRNKAVVNEPTQYAIYIVNQGRGNLTGIQVVVEIPAEMQFISATPKEKAQLPNNLNQITFGPFDLGPGGSTEVKVKVLPKKAGDARFRVTMQADNRAATEKEQATRIVE